MRAILLATLLALYIIIAATEPPNAASSDDTVPDWYHVGEGKYLEKYDLTTHALLFRTTRAEYVDKEVVLTLYQYNDDKYIAQVTWKLKCTSSGPEKIQSYEVICGDVTQTVNLASDEEFLTWELHGNGTVKLNGDGVESCPDRWGEIDVNEIRVGGQIHLEVTPPQGSTRCSKDKPYAYDYGKHCCSVNVEFQESECEDGNSNKKKCKNDRTTPCFNNIAVVKCPENHYMNKKSDINICDRCPVGEQLNGDKSGCGLCPAGSYKDNSMNECAECPDNEISTESRTSCTPCGAGKGPNSVQSACDPCEDGTYKGSSDTECTKCEDGMEPDSSRSACESCAAGSYKSNDMNECEECPDNKISTESRKSCTTCGPGEERNLDRTECGLCPAGRYKTSSMTQCKVCPDNTVSTGGAVLCTPCEPGQEPNSDRTACDPCAVGRYKNNSMNECAECSDNTVSTESRTSCTPCGAGEGPNSVQSACVTYCPELTNSDITYIFPNISLSPPLKQVKVKCTAGHVVQGSRVLLCTTDGTWNQLTLPSCRKYALTLKYVGEG